MKRSFAFIIGTIAGGFPAYGQTAQFSALQFFPATVESSARVITTQSIGGQVVTGRPFSAGEERHSLQVLGDGTRIETDEKNRLFRDEQGRTRIEHADGTVSITDPVGRFRAELDPKTRTVSRINMAPALAQQDLSKLRDELSVAEKTYSSESPSVKELRRKIAEQELRLTTETVYVQGRGRGASPAGVDSDIPRRVTFYSTPAEGQLTLRVSTGNNGAVESLPDQNVNGAMARGTRTTETIPAGKIGNNRPIKVVNERWFSDDLKLLIKSTSSDPRFGDTTYQLTNVTQISPDPSLFQIPADYTARK